MDTLNLCRSCMKEVASWEKENFDRRVVEMFCLCTNIEIPDDDKLPKQFCYDCVIKIESSFTFITGARKIDATLKNLISRSKTSVIVELGTHNTQTEKLTLTLPDYKVSVSADTYEDKVLFENNDIRNNNTPERCTDEPEFDNTCIDLEEDNQSILKRENVIETVNITNESQKYVCPVCRKSFTTKTWFTKHMKKQHLENNYTCAHCPKTFSKASSLADHAAAHSDERKFTCTVCSKRFKRRKQLNNHMRTHGEARPYACDKCNMSFKIKSILKSHMKVHDGDKPHLCSFCGWSFAQAGNLEVHIRKHTGEKPFSCNQCSFRAAVSSNLRRHMRQHMADRAYVCKHCSKGFYDASGLSRHERAHAGARPYVCPRCARGFADSWKRKTHLMRAHRLALADIPRMRRDGQPLLPPPAASCPHS